MSSNKQQQQQPSLSDDIKSLSDKDIGQKYKIVNDITKKLTENQYQKNEIDSILNTYLQNIKNEEDLHVKLIILNIVKATKNSDATEILLTCEDDVLVRKTIENCDFFWSNTELNYVNYYTTSLFSHFSYSDRITYCKILAKNFKNNHNKSEECYQKFKENFSLDTARPFLKNCCDNFIIDQLNYRVSPLKYGEILTILPDRREFIVKYVRILYEMYEKKTKFFHLIDLNSLRIILKELIKTHTSEVIQIVEKYMKSMVDFDRLKCGKQVSKFILLNDEWKNIIIKDPKYYLQILHRPSIYQQLNEDEFKQFYKNLFPVNKKTFDFNTSKEIFKCLDYYGNNKENKLKLLCETYKNCYNDDLLTSIGHIKPEILKLFKCEERIKFAQNLITQWNTLRGIQFNFDDLHCYLSYDVALSTFKDHIRSCSDSNKRLIYLELMIDTCAINEDNLSEALSDFLSYFVKRHRNEIQSVHVHIINKLCSSINLKKLNLEHWKQVHEIISIIYVSGDDYFSLDTSIFESYIRAEIKINNKSCENSMKIFLKVLNAGHFYYVTDLFENEPEFRRIYLEHFGKLIPKSIKKEDQRKQVFNAYLMLLSNWNKKYPKNILSICDYEWVCNQIEEILKKDKDDIIENEEYTIRTICNVMRYDKRAMEKYYKDFRELLIPDIDEFNYYLKNDPELIYRNADNICKEILSRCNIRSKIFKTKFAAEKLKNYCINKLKNDDDNDNLYEKKSRGIRILAYYLNGEEYFELVSKYYPEGERVVFSTKKQRKSDDEDRDEDDDNDDDDDNNDDDDNEDDMDIDKTKELIDYQKSIAYSLKFYKNYPNLFDILKKFCVGDYLKLVVGQLYTICLNLPYHKVKKFLDSNLDVPVSFKKHIIRLQFKINTKKSIIEVLQNLWTNEKNSTIREIIINAIVEYFIEEPTQQIWELLKKISLTLTMKTDLTAITKIMSSLDEISDRYQSEYFVYCWEWLNILKNDTTRSVDFIDLKCALLHKMTYALNHISEQIIFDILKDNLFENNSKNDIIQDRYMELAKEFVIMAKNDTDQEERINLIIQKSKNLILLHLKHDDEILMTENSRLCKKLIKDQLSKFYMYPIYYNSKHQIIQKILINLKKKLNEIFDSFICMHWCMITMEFAMIYYENNNLVEFGKNIRKIIELECTMYETYIIPKMASELKSFLKYIINAQIQDLISGLLHKPLYSINCALMVIELIDSKEIYDIENKMILDELKTINDKRIKIFLNDYC